MKEEKGAVQFGSRNIEFSVKRSNRRRTVSLFVSPCEGVYLRAPFGPSIETISKLVYTKAGWILKKQRQIEEIKESLPKREFVSGETWMYLGRQFRLKMVSTKGILQPEVKAEGNLFVVNLNDHYTEFGKQRICREVLSQWYKRRAQNVLKNRLDLYAEKLRTTYSGFFLANPRKRWGSCSYAGVVRLNWHIVMAPVSLIDYVVVHELCHLKFKNHSADYWKSVGTIMPDYESRRARLRKEGFKYIL